MEIHGFVVLFYLLHNIVCIIISCDDLFLQYVRLVEVYIPSIKSGIQLEYFVASVHSIRVDVCSIGVIMEFHFSVADPGWGIWANPPTPPLLFPFRKNS